MAKVFVTNIPVRTFIEGYVEIPDGITDPVERDNATRKALIEGKYTDWQIDLDSIEVEHDTLEGDWHLHTPLEKD